MNVVILTGKLTVNPELRYTSQRTSCHYDFCPGCMNKLIEFLEESDGE